MRLVQGGFEVGLVGSSIEVSLGAGSYLGWDLWVEWLMQLDCWL
jgi:hypothetical protein